MSKGCWLDNVRIFPSDSDSSEDELSLDHQRYVSAELGAGLASSDYRLSAMKELQMLLEKAYKELATKRVQAAVYEDVLVAVQIKDRRAAVQAAQAALVEAGKKVLAQQRKTLLVKAAKKTCMELARGSRRLRSRVECSENGCSSGVDGESEEEDEEAGAEDMPLEVLGVILKALDPVALARAGAVCRQWHQVVQMDEMWVPWLQRVFHKHSTAFTSQQQQQRLQLGSSSSELGDGPPVPGGVGGAGPVPAAGIALQLFSRLATAAPAKLLPWTSCRVLVYGKLKWHAPGSWNPLAGGTGAAAGAAGGAGKDTKKANRLRLGVCTPGPHFLTTDQVFWWLLGEDHRVAVLAGRGRRQNSSRRRGHDSDSSGASSSSEDEEPGASGGSTAAGGAASAAAAVQAVTMRLWAMPRVAQWE